MDSLPPAQAPPAQPVDPEAVRAPISERSAAAPDHEIGGRYRVIDALGRGGMGAVYRVRDQGTGRLLALKQLLLNTDVDRTRQATGLFEREFCTLAQMAHPRVIEVYDYGVDAAGPFYTMELLGGGDLRALSPLSVSHACILMLEVCSSLALLHARRLVHRDITPRNLRCTRDGHAKLIDFGAMVTMGPCDQTLGTPAFVAPEVVKRAAVDARTDLYSLGATLYYALTGHPPYAVKRFSDLREAWAGGLRLPSEWSSDVPPALDALCAALLRIDPAERPRTAFEVMQRLQAIVGVEHRESVEITHANVATPILVGRDKPLTTFRAHMRRALEGEGSSLQVTGPAGVGRTRLLHAYSLEAQTMGATVVRANAGRAPLGAAWRLARQLFMAQPQLAIEAAHRAQVHDALFVRDECGPCGFALRPLEGAGKRKRAAAITASLQAWLWELTATRPVVIVADDVELLDEPSVGWLARLALEGRPHRLLVITATDGDRRPADWIAHNVLSDYSKPLALQPLSLADTAVLLTSIFGDVPNGRLLADRLFKISLGNPRDTLTLVHHLIDTRSVRYEGGNWSLPSDLGSIALPKGAAEAVAARIDALTPLSRELVECQALLGTRALQRSEYAQLVPQIGPDRLEGALQELVGVQILQREGDYYRFGYRALAEIARSRIEPARSRERHQALYDFYDRQPQTNVYSKAHHVLEAGHPERALELLTKSAGEAFARADLQLLWRSDVRVVVRTLERALSLSMEMERPLREQYVLRRDLCAWAALDRFALFKRHHPIVLERLCLDAGLKDYRALDPDLPRVARLQKALARASARYARTPADERVYRVDDAMTLLVMHVFHTVVIAGLSNDPSLLSELPELLEPFAHMHPGFFSVYQHTLAAREASCLGRPLRALQRWQRLYDSLEGVRDKRRQRLRLTVASHICGLGVGLGKEHTFHWARIIDGEPHWQVHALLQRRLACLWEGDHESAAKYEVQAEKRAVQADTLHVRGAVSGELFAAALARDLGAVKRVAEEAGRRARRAEGWQPLHLVAQGTLQQLSGDLPLAERSFREALRLLCVEGQPPSQPACWSAATAGLVEALAAQGRAYDAVDAGQAALSLSRALGFEVAWHCIASALAMVEADLGHGARATELCKDLVADLQARGLKGLSLAQGYATAARVAARAGDNQAFARLGALAVRALPGLRVPASHGLIAPVLSDGRERGMTLELARSDFEADVLGGAQERGREPDTPPNRELSQLGTPGERVEQALRLVCRLAGAGGGQLYLLDRQGALMHRARFNAPAPDTLAVEYARGFFAQQIEDEELSSGLTQTTHRASLESTATYIDTEGGAHPLVMLACRRGAELVYAGLAVLDGAAGSVERAQLVAQGPGIASALLVAGDCGGQRLSDLR